MDLFLIQISFIGSGKNFIDISCRFSFWTLGLFSSGRLNRTFLPFPTLRRSASDRYAPMLAPSRMGRCEFSQLSPLSSFQIQKENVFPFEEKVNSRKRWQLVTLADECTPLTSADPCCSKQLKREGGLISLSPSVAPVTVVS
jgi:hypothetical protein